MRIGICDDEEIIREEVLRLCNKFQETNLIEFDLVQFSCGEDLIKYKEPIDILFLDIQMKELNGLRTAKKIREHDDNMSIIFVTGHRAFALEGYRVKAFRYILKPIKEQDLMKALGDVILDLTKNTKAVVGLDGKTIFVKLREIIYIEYLNRCTLVRTKNYIYESVMKMSEWEEILNTGDFYRVHKSYIVNMEYVEEIGKSIVMENGEKVELAFRQIPKFKRACKEYRRRNAR